MADYISREAAIKVLTSIGAQVSDSRRRAVAKCINEIELLHAAGVEPVRRWIPVTERMPENEKDVLITCDRNGYRFVCPAMHTDGKTLSQDSIWNWNDLYAYGLYDENADDYYIPEGWWEYRQFNPDDVYNNPVDCEVTHWMPLPEPPKMDGGAENG